jgi:hypothetical protein
MRDLTRKTGDFPVAEMRAALHLGNGSELCFHRSLWRRKPTHSASLWTCGSRMPPYAALRATFARISLCGPRAPTKGDTEEERLFFADDSAFPLRSGHGRGPSGMHGLHRPAHPRWNQALCLYQVLICLWHRPLLHAILSHSLSLSLSLSLPNLIFIISNSNSNSNGISNGNSNGNGNGNSISISNSLS